MNPGHAASQIKVSVVTRHRRALAAAAAVTAALAVGLTGAATASASTELGQVQPIAKHGACEVTLNLAQISSAADATYEVPAGGGVLTEWRHQGGTVEEEPGAGRLQVWRNRTGVTYELVGDSDLEPIVPTMLNEFGTRIPVAGGDLLGLRSEGKIGCISEGGYGPLDVAAAEPPSATTSPRPGDSAVLAFSVPASRLNVAATLEPDADGDGFGDETQDLTATLKLKNKLGARGPGFPVKVSCGTSDCDGTVSGVVIAKQKGGSTSASAAKKSTKKLKLKPKAISVDAGKATKTKVKLKKHAKKSRQLSRLLKSDRAYRKGSTLKLTVRLTNALGAPDTLKDNAKLKP